MQEHWLTIRKIAGDWWDFNSLLPAPRQLGEFFLGAFLATLRQQGYSIFVAQGSLPVHDSGAQPGDGSGSWFTPEQVSNFSTAAFCD